MSEHDEAVDPRIAVAFEMFRAWEDLDWARVMSLFAPDAVLHSVMLKPAVGREAIAKLLAGLAKGLTRIALNVREIGVINGRVFVERVDDFDFDGHHGEVPVVGILRVHDDHVTEWLEYFDHPSLLRGMGLLGDKGRRK